QPLFVSIDPERDRRLGLAAYTAAFHPAILGLAGTEAETQAAAHSFKIFYGRENDAAVPDGYSMAHSPGLFLIGPDGEWLRQFTYGTPAADILSDLQTRF
ncbi:MAG: SCO family protein, partial [Paracoccaceae bacterium]|nr:SCO family protein [Paracoccaceae bacterium]